MAKSEKRYWFAAHRNAIHNLSAEDVMDMLRYDAARVHAGGPDDYYLMSKAETGGYPPPTIARWKSFGVRIVIIAVSTYQPDPSEVVRLFEADTRMTPW